ncbi:carboxylesterase [Gracilibacillus boraciitolerans JCM 21714]|uniref:Carboxylesterase n=1 Tax=Gracilibacillus boraciitolerans JCM 21714 TaxID=1298598 RepID=W4VJH3_9BACI|nr:alpha/beta fold hydrolase [Gracilibacillus boraciitolerans]GAE93545.1 carboxylesterase [Gracilibacillus boraciitolerans JCM 21714]
MTACLLIHGFTGGPYEVEPLAIYLKEKTDWHVEIPSLPGHGLGEGKDLNLADVTYKDWINKAEEVYLKLATQHTTIYLVGFSMGGMITAYLAAKYSVKGLVLLSTSRKYISIPQIGVTLVDFSQKAVRKKLKNDPLFSHYISKYGAVPVKSTIEFLKCMRFTKPYLKRIHCPVFIAQGIQDGIVPYKSAHYLDKEIPADAEIIYFHDSRHLICLGEDKDLVVEAVYQFLKKENKKLTNH